MIFALRTQQRYLQNILSAPATERIRERIAEEISLNVQPSILAERPDASESYLRTVGDFIGGGAVNTLLSWLEDPQGRSEDEIVDTIVGVLPDWLAREPRA